MDIHEARDLAECYIEDNAPPVEGDRYVIVDSSTLDTEQGWYFYWQTSKFVETGDMNFAVVGSPPILIAKDGSFVGPARPKIAR
ncbi:hypothetical protein ACVWZA_002446 [Sphingomonas sp. UYAg733]